MRKKMEKIGSVTPALIVIGMMLEAMEPNHREETIIWDLIQYEDVI